MATTTNHHYVPQFYLRGFSNGFGRQAQVFVFDSETKKSFTTLVRNIGSRRNFNRIEASGVGPNFLEDEMAKIEDKIAPHLIAVKETKSFPSPEHFNSIMYLAALLSVRNPRLRRVMTDFHKDVIDGIMDTSLASKERWQSQIKGMQDKGVPLNDDITFEEMKRFQNEKNFEIRIDQTYLIGLELEMVEPVLKLLSQRNWCFATAALGHQFITSDDPTVLSWDDTVRQPSIYSPGHGMANTIVILTLSAELALIGSFEQLPKQSLYLPHQVTALNTAVARQSRKQLYAKDGNFLVHLSDGSSVLGSGLPRFLTEKTKNKIHHHNNAIDGANN